MIPEKILSEYGAIRLSLAKDSVIFNEGDEALNYFQVAEGSVKMVTTSQEGQDFIQGISYQGESFGEPPILCQFPYPSSALAIEDSVIWKLRKEKFYNLIRENFDIHLKLDQVLCERLRYKNKILSSIAFDGPENRVWWLINYLKDKSERAGLKHEKFVVPLTRQQIADMIGMRVETVIRTVKKLQDTGRVDLVNHKILV